MESPWMIDHRKAVTELTEGNEFAIQLRSLLKKPCGDDGALSSANDLVTKILQSFSNSLSLLKSSGESNDVCQSPMTAQAGSPCSDDRKSENSGEKRKIPAVKDRRGGYKRRKNAETRIEFTPAPIEDGFAWRKYGQKEILNSKFPRNYFRCTHRSDGCQAVKQVQKTEEEPPTYRTIYMGHHTCRNKLRAPQLIIDSPPTQSYMFNFQSNTTVAHDHHNFSSFALIKEERQDEIPNDHASSSDYLVSADLNAFEASGPTSVFASTPGSDHGDVISSTCTTNSRESFDNMEDFIVGSVNFDDDVFHFGDEFLLCSSI